MSEVQRRFEAFFVSIDNLLARIVQLPTGKNEDERFFNEEISEIRRMVTVEIVSIINRIPIENMV